MQTPREEGKTKAALLAVEVLAARFGMDGVFVGMPTQATCDCMFTNVRRWLLALDPDLVLPFSVAVVGVRLLPQFNAGLHRG